MISTGATQDPADVLTAALRERGMRVTSQRVVLFRALSELGRHATAEEIARAAAERLPGLALPTVYAALELFEGLGLVRRVPTGAAVMWDPVADGHAHLACRACGRVVDVDARVDTAAAIRAVARAGGRVDGAEVVLRGLCERCAAGAETG